MMAAPVVQFGPGLGADRAAARVQEDAFAAWLPDAGAASLEDVKRIILAFYSPTIGSDLRRRLDRWLQAYQRRTEAWAMADQFLQVDLLATSAGGAALLPPEQTQQLMLFAALTMHSKIRFDFLDLPPESHPALRDTLLRHVTRLVTVPAGRGPVLSRLCLAFSSLVVQSGALGGEEAVNTAVQLFPPPGGTLPLLEILTTLAEEARSSCTSIPERRRDAFLGGLRATGGPVLGLLQQVITAGEASGNDLWLERGFKCLSEWIYAVDLPPALVASSPLIPCVFESLLRHSDLLGVISDVVHNLLLAYKRPERDGVVIARLLPLMLQLEPMYDKLAQDSDDEDVVVALVRMFADAGTTYLKPIIASATQGSDAQAQMLMRQLFSLIIKCSGSAEPAVSAATFPFWQKLYEHLFSASHDPAATSLKAQLASTMVELARRMTDRLRCPEEFERWTADKRDNFKHTYRYDVSDVLLCCCEVAGYKDVLLVMAGKLQEELGKWQAAGGTLSGSAWTGVEATMYAIRAIARYVPDDEGTVMPPLFSLLHQLPRHPELLCTSFRLIGRYNRWMAKHPELAVPCLEFVVQHGLLPRPGAQASEIPITSPQQECACNAVKELGSSVAGVPAFRDALLALPGRVNLLAMHEVNACKVYQAVCHAIGSLPPNGHGPHISGLLQPVLGALSAFAADPESACATAGAQGLLLAVVTFYDGVVRECQLRNLGIDEGTAEALLVEGHRNGGRVSWNPAVLRVEKAAPAVVAALLSRLTAVLQDIRVDRNGILVAHGMPTHLELQRLPPDQREAMENTSRELIKAADDSIGRCLAEALDASWPVLQGLANRFHGHEAVLGTVGSVWDHAMRHDPVGFKRVLPQLLPMLSAFACDGRSVEVLNITRTIVNEYAPPQPGQGDHHQPHSSSSGSGSGSHRCAGSDDALAGDLFALACRVLDCTLALVLRPDLGQQENVPTSPSASSSRPPALPPRGTRVVAEEPYLLEPAFRLATALLTALPEQTLGAVGMVDVPTLVPGALAAGSAAAFGSSGAAAAPSSAASSSAFGGSGGSAGTGTRWAPIATGPAQALACGPLLPALVAASAASLAAYDWFLTHSVCLFLRQLCVLALEPPNYGGGGGGPPRGDFEDGFHPHHFGGGGGRHGVGGRGAGGSASRAAASANAAAQAVLQRRASTVLPLLTSPLAIAPAALGVTGRNALVVPLTGGCRPDSPAGERLYKRAAAASLKEFPAEVLSTRESTSMTGGTMLVLQRLFPAAGAGGGRGGNVHGGGGGGGNVQAWLEQLLSDPAVLRPGLVPPARLSELALALLGLGQSPSESQFAVCLADLADAVRGRDGGAPAGAGARGGGGNGGRRYGVAAEDDEDEFD